MAEIDRDCRAVLDYLATLSKGARQIHEAVVLNRKTSDKAVASLASSTSDGTLLELIAINQQRLVRFPEIIEAILANSARSAEAERRARETKQEFFEKERGAQQIAQELRARGQSAAAEFFESAELTESDGKLPHAAPYERNLKPLPDHILAPYPDLAAQHAKIMNEAVPGDTQTAILLALGGLLIFALGMRLGAGPWHWQDAVWTREQVRAQLFARGRLTTAASECIDVARSVARGLHDDVEQHEAIP